MLRRHLLWQVPRLGKLQAAVGPGAACSRSRVHSVGNTAAKESAAAAVEEAAAVAAVDAVTVTAAAAVRPAADVAGEAAAVASPGHGRLKA